jgi:hypothetical protein
MSELLILDLHNLAFDAIKTMNSSRSFQIISERQAETAPLAFSGVFFIFLWGMRVCLFRGCLLHLF